MSADARDAPDLRLHRQVTTCVGQGLAERPRAREHEKVADWRDHFRPPNFDLVLSGLKIAGDKLSGAVGDPVEDSRAPVFDDDLHARCRVTGVNDGCYNEKSGGNHSAR